jgi:hypothetical protein
MSARFPPATNPDPLSPALVRSADLVIVGELTSPPHDDVAQVRVIETLHGVALTPELSIELECDRFGYPAHIGVFVLKSGASTAPFRLLTSSSNETLTPRRTRSALAGGPLTVYDPSEDELRALSSRDDVCILLVQIAPAFDGMSATLRVVEGRLVGRPCPVVGEKVFVTEDGWDLGRSARVAGLVLRLDTTGAWNVLAPPFAPDPSLYRRLDWRPS